MKAAILIEARRPLVVADVELPAELSYGQVHVRLLYSGICGAQLNEIDEVKGPDRFLPHLLGHEGTGVVLRTGVGVRRVRAGDHVVLHWMPAAGLQGEPPTYRWAGRAVNAGYVTTFNTEAIVSENRLTVIPADADMRAATLFGCAMTTAAGVIGNDARLTLGQSLLIIGLGGVGLCLVKAGKLAGAQPVVGLDVHAAKLDLAVRCGLDAGWLAGESRLRERILETVGAQGVDVAVETTGNPQMIEVAYELTQPRGRTILVGVPAKGNKASIYTLPLHFDHVLKGSRGGDVEPDLWIPRLLGLVRAGRLRLDDIVAREFPLEGINDAIALLRGGVPGRLLIRLGGGAEGGRP